MMPSSKPERKDLRYSATAPAVRSAPPGSATIGVNTMPKACAAQEVKLAHETRC